MEDAIKAIGKMENKMDKEFSKIFSFINVNLFLIKIIKIALDPMDKKRKVNGKMVKESDGLMKDNLKMKLLFHDTMNLS
jgi:hypothetical protein